MPADADPPELSKADYEALAAFRYALRRFLAFSDAAIREKGVTPQQHQALLAIKASRDESLTIGALAEALLLQHHSGGSWPIGWRPRASSPAVPIPTMAAACC